MMTDIHIKLREWSFVAIVALVAVGLSLVPTIVGFARAPAGQTYLGTNVPDVMDSQLYYAFIQHNAEGHYLYRNLFTSEPHPAILWHPLWLGLGLAVRFTGWSPVIVFTMARAGLGLVLIGLLYVLTSLIFQTIPWRRVALLATTFGSGFGGWLLLWADRGHGLIWANLQPNIVSHLPADVTYQAGTTFFSIYHSPLFLLNEILLLTTWIFFWLSWRRTDRRFIHLAGLSAMLLVLIHPYDIVLVLGIVLVWFIIGVTRGLLQSATGWRYIQHTFILFVWTLPAIGYYAAVLLTQPVARAWYRQFILTTSSGWDVLLGYGLLVPLAWFGLRRYWLSRPWLTAILTGWIIGAIILMYFPHFTLQAKMIEGFSIPMALAASLGLQVAYGRIKRHWPAGNRHLGLLVAVPLIAFMGATPFIYMAKIVQSEKIEPLYHFAPNEELTALVWLHDHTPADSIILGDVLTGNLVPRYAGRATYVGHNAQTIDFAYKRDVVRLWFYGTNGDQDRKKIFLRDNSIDVVVWGPNEKRQGDYRPDRADYLQLIKIFGTVEIYRVLPDNSKPEKT